jgi:cysteinyl-tRNA synthetase
VRPSWHVQCSAMARAHLGDRFDIHTASVDLVFPHNENEIAQSRALTGQTQANYWLHSELVLSGGKKLSYVPEAYVTLPDLLAKGYSAREVRFLLLRHHYRQPVHLTDEELEVSRATLRRIDLCVTNLLAVEREVPCVAEVDGWILDMKEEFRRALLDDLDTPAALAGVFRLVRQANYLMAEQRLCTKHATAMLKALGEADQVLAVLIPESSSVAPAPEAEQLVAQREEARRRGDFAEADRLRLRIEALGYSVEDRPDGPRLARR